MRLFIFCFPLMFYCSINLISAQSDSLIVELEKTIQTQIETLGKEHLDIAMYCDSLGRLYLEASKYEQADSLYNIALDIKFKNFDETNPSIADSYLQLGKIYRYTGNYAKADSILNKALDIRLDLFGTNHPDIASVYLNLGNVSFMTSDYEKAIIFYEKALDIRLEVYGKNHRDVAWSYLGIANVYQTTGDYVNAIIFNKKALKIWIDVQGEKHPDIGLFYNNLGLVYSYIGDYEKAIYYHNKAVDDRIETLGENHHELSSSYNNLGLVYYATGDYEKAIFLYKKALNNMLLSIDENHPDVARTYNNLGNTYEIIGDYEKAINFHEKALNIKLDIFSDTHPAVAYSYISLGTVSSSTGDYEKAIEFYEKALNIWFQTAGKNHPNVAGSYKSLGTVNSSMGNYEKAIYFYEKALNIWLEVFDIQHPNVTETYYNLAVANENNNNYKAADSLWQIVVPNVVARLKSTYLFLPNDQRIKYSNTLTSMSADFYSFAATKGTESTKHLATNLLLNTKSLALDYAISAKELIKKTNDSILIAQYEQLNELNKQITDVEYLTDEERKEEGWDLLKIREEQANLSSKILQHPQFKSKLNSKIIEWQDIQNNLLTDEVVLGFIEVYEKKDSLWVYYAQVIQKGYTNLQFVRITDATTLAKSLNTDTEERPNYLSNRKTRKALYETLWQPLEPYLRGIKTVNISPSGILHRIPFESLQDTENEFLAVRYNFHYYSAIRDMLKEKPAVTTYKDMVLLGHILYDLDNKDKHEDHENTIALVDEKRNIRNGILPLPETLKEVTEINRTSLKAGIQTSLLTIAAASEDTLQYFIKDKAPSIFHFATHGIFLPSMQKENPDRHLNSRDRLRSAENPLQRSALMLYGANETWTKGKRILGSSEDGILTALEVTELDLQNTDLVVLSACSSGLGNVHNTEGVFGLQRAFKLAGVNYVIASLWDVNDTATKDLMVAFYTNLLQKKQDPATALRKAKAALRNEGYEPVDWAGFILIE